MPTEAEQNYAAQQAAQEATVNAVSEDMKKLGLDRGFDMRSFKIRPGETIDDWTNRVDKYTQDTKGDWIGLGKLQGGSYLTDYLRKNGSKYEALLKPNYSNPVAEAAKAKETSKEQSIDQAVRDYYNKMMSPLDQNDPEVKALVDQGRGVAQSQAANRGIRGGLSDAGVTKAALDSTRGLQQFRQGQGLQALGLANNRELGLRNLAMQKYQMQRENELAGYNSQKANSQAVGSAIGGVGGAVVGGYFGGPAGAAAGAQAGSGLIGGLSGTGSSYTPTAMEPYKGGAF